ncbi:MAG: SUMF1/EgtB/PvdO family nonheme iron enzyme [Planctomycetes bacterium]|nr:SUMF1/EgtB/PvdO family nonheme iron enzyme [Planctomycetota bacterium]
MPTADYGPARPNRIGRYRILDDLGEGGMGTVYLAEQTEPVSRRVAVKVIKLGMDTKAVVARFEQERQALALMDHEGIAKVFDCGTTERGQPYFVMELAKGVPMTQFCQQRRLAVADRVRLIQEVCAAVQHAHQKGVIHRDLKPGNVLVTDGPDGSSSGRAQIKIIDFGLAKAMGPKLVEATLFTEAGQIVGTPEYMAPEQADPTNQDIDTRVDVYALGVMLYQVLVGELPFPVRALRQDGMLEWQRVLRDIDPPKPSTMLASVGSAQLEIAEQRRTNVSTLRTLLRSDLDWVVLKALAKERDRRYQTPAELAADLQRFLDNEAVLAGPPSATYRLRKFLLRYRGQVIAAALVFLATLGGGIATFVQYLRAEDARIEASDNLDKVERLLDFSAAQVLLARADELYPATPEVAPAMRDWLAEVDERLQRLEVYRREATPPRDDDVSRAVADFEQLAALRPAIAARYELACSLAATTIDGERAAWDRAASAIVGSPRYHGLVLTPQIGLVPLGANPQGLQEFWHTASGTRPLRGADRELLMTPDNGIVLVLVPGGTDGPRAFFLAKFEVTQAQWERAMGTNPALYRPPAAIVRTMLHGEHPTVITPLHPVESVSWRDCQVCARRLDLRLPTEAEWQFGAEAGSGAAFCWGDDPASLAGNENMLDRSATPTAVAQHGLDCDDGYPLHAPVGSFARNPFGLCDMLGNVSEWCADLYESDDPTDSKPWRRTFRGGNWWAPVATARPSYRQYENPNGLNQARGVRLARDLRR